MFICHKTLKQNLYFIYYIHFEKIFVLSWYITKVFSAETTISTPSVNYTSFTTSSQ